MTRLRLREEGVRIKHRLNDNSVKLYDKAYTELGNVLRAEATLNTVVDFRVYRPKEGDPHGEDAVGTPTTMSWLASLHHCGLLHFTNRTR